MRKGLAVLLAGGLMLAQASTGVAATWVAYVNERFGTSADVPGEGFVADPPPENGDGRGWTSLDGRGEIAVYGSYIVEGVADNLQEYRQFLLDSARDAGVKVTYQAGKADWFAYSGYAGDAIVYRKVIVAKACGLLVGHHVTLKYPEAQRAAYRPIVEHVARTLRGGGPADCP